MFTVEIVEGPESAVDDAGWWHYAYQLRCRYGRRSFVTPWRQGEGITQDPTARGVLECFLSDASSADQAFEDWAGDYGYDTDNRKAYETFQQVQKQTENLRRIFGADWDRVAFNLGREDTERVARRYADAA